MLAWAKRAAFTKVVGGFAQADICRAVVPDEWRRRSVALEPAHGGVGAQGLAETLEFVSRHQNPARTGNCAQHPQPLWN
jgi:hypothetical protein